MTALEQFMQELEGQKGLSRFSVVKDLQAPLVGQLVMKAIVSGPLVPEYIGIVPAGTRRPTLRSLIPGGTTTQGTVFYQRETAFDNKAAPVPPGQVKPGTTLTWASVSTPVVTLAHWVKLSTQVWDDFPALQAMLETRLLYGLTQAEEKEVISGDGTAGHMEGLLKVATATTGITTPVTPDKLAEALATAAGEVANAGYIPSGIVVNTADWSAALRSKNSTSGDWSLGTPGAAEGRMLWGLPVVSTPAMPVGQFIVGDFMGCQIFDRETAVMEVSNENQDDFVKDLLTAMAEERLAFAIYQPGAFRKAG